MGGGLASPVLVAFAGHIGAGKTSLAGLLCRDYGFVKVSFAEPIRWICEVTERPATREWLQRIGSGLRSYQPSFWVAVAYWRIRDLLEEGRSVVIDDLRFPNEALMIRELGGVIVLLHVTPEEAYARLKRRNSAKDKGIDSFEEFMERMRHDSEVAVDELEARRLYDVYVDTTSLSLEEVYERVKNLLGLETHITVKASTRAW